MSFLDIFIKKPAKNKKNYYYIPSKNTCFCECDELKKIDDDARKLPFSEDLRLLIDKILQIRPEDRNQDQKIVVVGDVAWVAGIGIILVERGNWPQEIRENWICIRESIYPRLIELGLFPDFQEPNINSYEILVFESLHDVLYLAEKAQENVLGHLSYSAEQSLKKEVMRFKEQIIDMLSDKNTDKPYSHNEKIMSVLCQWGKSAYRFEGSTEFNEKFSLILMNILKSKKIPTSHIGGTINNIRWWIRQPVIDMILDIIHPKKPEK